LLPTERNKTLTALANTEPLVGAQRKEAQGLQWFLSESTWDAEAINERRIELLLEDPRTAPNEKGALGSSTRPATARTPRRPLMWG
jgi:SRSO17 transposase